MICYLYEAPTHLFFAPGLPDLLYYSHIPAALVALFVGLFIYLNQRNLLLNKLLLAIALCFSLWTLASLTAWTNIDADFLAFIWPSFAVLNSFISLLSIYFIYVFLEGKDVSFKKKLIFIALLLPVLVFGHTNLSISGFNITNCDAFGFEGLLYKIYYSSLGVLSFFWILVLLINKYRKTNASQRTQIILMGIGMEFFLLSFLSLTFIATYLAGIGVFPDSSLELYGLFGMMVFMIFIAVLMVKFKTFKVGIIAPQALVVALVVIIASQFTFLTSNTSIVLTSITLILTCVTGYLLIRSAKKEIKQRQQIEQLAAGLAKANDRLKQLDKLKSEFVSIASHQLRSPITAIAGYTSLLREGSYGEVSAKMKEPLERIEKSARMMATSIEDYLNVSRIESGNMKYNYSEFNLVEEVEHICDDLRTEALKQNLILLFRKRVDGSGFIKGDIGKVQQIIHNLLNNSIKYTQKGAITVYVHDDVKAKKIFVDVMDTGVGMSEATLHTIFQKFERGDSANKVNVKGTGLGLYVALKMAEAMGGDITAHSEGEGEGSRFTIELPLAI